MSLETDRSGDLVGAAATACRRVILVSFPCPYLPLPCATDSESANAITTVFSAVEKLLQPRCMLRPQTQKPAPGESKTGEEAPRVSHLKRERNSEASQVGLYWRGLTCPERSRAGAFLGAGGILRSGPSHLRNPKGRVLGFEVIDLRRFEAAEFSPLLEAESCAWGEGLRWDFAPSAQIISNCLREKRLSGYALVLEGKVRGYCFFFYDGEKGLIGDLFVEPSVVGTEQALRLLEHVIETLLGTPGLHRVEAQIPHFRFEDLEPCFAAHRFESYLRRFMRLLLVERAPLPGTSGIEPSGQTAAGPEIAEDFLMAPWERRYDHEAAELLHAAYRRHVDAMINDQYQSIAGASRLVENIVRQQGCGEYLQDVSRVAIHRPSQRLAGILAVTTVRPRTAHIPQIAIAPTFQGHGLGTALMLDSFQILSRQGFQEVSLTVTDANGGAVRLYQHLGFETFRTFGAFVYNRP